MSASDKLSLVAHFDDLMRCKSVLTAGNESEFLRFVQNQEQCRIRWKDSRAECLLLQQKNAALEKENMALKTKLKHARSQIEYEICKRRRIEQERERLSRQVEFVREFLSEKTKTHHLEDKDLEPLAFLYDDVQPTDTDAVSPSADAYGSIASLMSPDDISYDRTEEDLDISRPGGATRNRSALGHCGNSSAVKHKFKSNHRRSRSVGNIVEEVQAESLIDEAVGDESSRHRRFSTPCSNTPDAAVAAAATELLCDAEDAGGGGDTGTEKNVSDGRKERWNSGGSLAKAHIFASKTVIKPETCNACGKKIRFGRDQVKCKDCRISLHPQCRNLAPLPCVPCSVTPTNKNGMCILANCVGSDPPLIPEIVIRCVNEVESRGLSEPGLYRLSGSQLELKALTDRCLKGKGVPNLANIPDINVVAGLLKEFLRNLEQPLVTHKAWFQFLQAAEKTDADQCRRDLCQLVDQLPEANRDTLAFLMLHLQKVAEVRECRMPVINLARVFGPTIVGFSHPVSSKPGETASTLMEAKQQHLILEKLLSIPIDYWRSFIEVGEVAERFHHAYAKSSVNTQYRHFDSMFTTPSTIRKQPSIDHFNQTEQIIRKPQHFFSSPNVD